MSLRYRDSSGNETIVSGLTPGGDIEAGAMAERNGTFDISVGAGSFSYYTITFDEPMPDDDYIVSFYGPTTSQQMQYLFFNSDFQTANGFRAVVNNVYSTTISRTGIRYKAVKTYSVQHAAETAEAVNTIQSLIPAGAGSTNQLTTKNYVDNADTALNGRVSDIEDLVPTGASVTNQLTTKSYVDEAIQHVEIDVDDELDSTSENPVQNKVVKAAIDKKQDKVFVGTVAEWEALTPVEKNKYQLVNLTDDQEALGVDAVDAVTDGDMRPVTSNAVYDTTRIVLGTVEIAPLTIAAGQVATFNNTSNAIKGKRFNGIEVLNVASFNISVTQAFIDNDGFHGVIKNNGSSEITTGRIIVHYSN